MKTLTNARSKLQSHPCTVNSVLQSSGEVYKQGKDEDGMIQIRLLGKSIVENPLISRKCPMMERQTTHQNDEKKLSSPTFKRLQHHMTMKTCKIYIRHFDFLQLNFIPDVKLLLFLDGVLNYYFSYLKRPDANSSLF